MCQSVVTLVSPAKTVEPIEMPFGLRAWMGPRIKGSIFPLRSSNFKGEGQPIVKYSDILP